MGELCEILKEQECGEIGILILGWPKSKTLALTCKVIGSCYSCVQEKSGQIENQQVFFFFF